MVDLPAPVGPTRAIISPGRACKEMQFNTKFDKTAVKAKFKLKDMVFNGKVEM